MKNNYLKHFWLLYFDFLAMFKGLMYQNIPIPLMSKFYHYLDGGIRQQMMNPNFKNYLNHIQLDEKNIQPHIERYFPPLTRNAKKNPNGKVLLTYENLRFSSNTFKEYFDPNQTLIVSYANRRNFMGIPCHTFDQYSLDVTQPSHNLINRAKQVLNSYGNHPVFGNQNFKQKFFYDIQQIVKHIAASNQLLKKVNVSCIVVGTTEDVSQRVLTVVAAQRGIPSICMQHGVIMGEEAYMPVFASKQAVYGQYEKEFYLSQGVSPNRLEVIGHPKMDSIFTHKQMTKQDLQMKCGLTKGKKYILITTQPFMKDSWEQLVHILVKDPSYEIIIKPHPWEVQNNKHLLYQKLAFQYEAVKVITGQHIELYSLLSNVDVVVVSSSTVGLEAMLFDRYVAIFRGGNLYYNDLKDFRHNDPQKLKEIIGQLTRNTETQKDFVNVRNKFISYAYPKKLSGFNLFKLIYQLSGNRSFLLKNQPYNGKLIQGSNVHIYLVQKNMKRHIYSPNVVRGLGFTGREVIRIPDGVLNKIPTGLMIRSPNDAKR